MSDTPRFAPGWPGIPARWTTSAKEGIGASLNPDTRVWFTVSHGIMNEIYYSDVDQACTRDLGLLVTGANNFFSEEKRHTRSRISYLDIAAPACHYFNRCVEGLYVTEKEIIADPAYNAILQRTRFSALKGPASSYHLYAILAPHIRNRGMGNAAWVGEYHGTPVLFAQRDGVCLAFACSPPWIKCSVGFVGFSDGWQDISRHHDMEWEYTRAENGNVALTGEIDHQMQGGTFVLSIGFGANWSEAAEQAFGSLNRNFEDSLALYIAPWRAWQKSLRELGQPSTATNDLYRRSTAVLRSSGSKSFPGGIIASLSIPWGSSKGDDDLGGYHLVWPRDLVETGGALLAAGAHDQAKEVLRYLHSTQLSDGHWPQNMWLDGSPYWTGIQMDETAFPILLLDIAVREHALTSEEALSYWPMVRKAAAYLIQNGPVTQQDRWEEDPGYSPFTLAVEIAGLLAAADCAENASEHLTALHLRETADIWNANIEKWTYVTDTDLARKLGVEGYYVRIAPVEVSEAASPLSGFVSIKNRPPGDSMEPSTRIVSPDALALVRFGLRSGTDTRIKNTVTVIDALLKASTTHGDSWHRYDFDGYGEHDDGSPFDGTGKGRAWPLLTGERAHFEFLAGNHGEAERLKTVMESFANEGGMISEQIWDSADIPSVELHNGRPSGSAMPLAWAHAEYIKLCRSLHDGKVFDIPQQTTQRYLVENNETRLALWKFSHKCRTIPRGKELRIELLNSAAVHWSTDMWHSSADAATQDTGLGIYFVDLPTHSLESGSSVCFTFLWNDDSRWEGTNFEVTISER